MSTKIGELNTQSGQPLLKMWDTVLAPCSRPFVRHFHPRFEITVVNGGSGVYTTDTAVYPMEPGDVFVFSSNEVHWITEATQALSMTNLHFKPRYLSGEFSGDYGNGYAAFCFFHAEDFQNRIPAEHAFCLREHHRTIAEEFEKKEDQYPLAVHSHLLFMLIELLRRHGYQSSSLIGSTSADLLAVYDYIDCHCHETLTLRELSAVVGISPNYFSHKFKEWSGISLWDYITAKRIEKAVSLILAPDKNMTMLEIALQCGFNNTVNFNKAFKKQKGFSPSALKKNPKLFWH